MRCNKEWCSCTEGRSSGSDRIWNKMKRKERRHIENLDDRRKMIRLPFNDWIDAFQLTSSLLSFFSLPSCLEDVSSSLPSSSLYSCPLHFTSRIVTYTDRRRDSKMPLHDVTHAQPLFSTISTHSFNSIFWFIFPYRLFHFYIQARRQGSVLNK